MGYDKLNSNSNMRKKKKKEYLYKKIENEYVAKMVLPEIEKRNEALQKKK